MNSFNCTKKSTDRKDTRISVEIYTQSGNHIEIEGFFTHNVIHNKHGVYVSFKIVQDCGDNANIQLNLRNNDAVIMNKNEIIELGNTARTIFNEMSKLLPRDIKNWISAGLVLNEPTTNKCGDKFSNLHQLLRSREPLRDYV